MENFDGVTDNMIQCPVIANDQMPDALVKFSVFRCDRTTLGQFIKLFYGINNT